jgi:Flp pilus assembly protein TadB
MVRAVPTFLAIFAGALMLVALVAMTTRNLQVAGMCFLSASLVIYIRERWYGSGRDEAGNGGNSDA